MVQITMAELTRSTWKGQERRAVTWQKQNTWVSKVKLTSKENLSKDEAEGRAGGSQAMKGSEHPGTGLSKED